MRERAIVHVAGPKGAGKTTLIELLVHGFDGFVLTARCIRDDKLKRLKETAPKTHPELVRYRHAGASGVALLTFPEKDIGSDAFFCTDLMTDYSNAVLIEGESPIGFADVEVFVAPPLKSDAKLLVRQKRDRAEEARAKTSAMEKLLREPDGVARLFGQMLGAPLADAMKKNPGLMRQQQEELLEGIAKLRNAPPPKPTEHWAIAEGYAGIEHSGVVVVNADVDEDREGAERILADLDRIRRDRVVFDDVLGAKGKKTPITAVIADLSNARDAGTKKAVARIRRSMKLAS